MDLLSNYIIHQADSALILGHRNSEWTGHGPILEQDIALSNISLDLIGQARNFYQLAASRINEMSIKETRYHVKWSSEWVIRLGDGTSESHLRMTRAQQDLNPYIAELFISSDFDYEAESSGAGILPEQLKDEWYQRVNKIFEAATLPS